MKRLAWGSVVVAVLGAILLLAWPSGPSASRTDPTPAAVVPPELAPFRPALADTASPAAAIAAGAVASAEPTPEQREAFAAGVKRRIAEHRDAAGERRSQRAERREARRLERLEHARSLRGGRPRPEQMFVVPVEPPLGGAEDR
jgi:hypothetical protein